MRLHHSIRVAILAAALFGDATAFPQATSVQVRPAIVNIDAYVAEAAQRFGIPEHWIYAVIRAESAGRIGAVSSAGAMGLMQLMPMTWARQRTLFGLGTDPFDPRDNILAGTSYLREMFDSYGASGFLAAYNAGPGRYEDWRDRGRPLPAETRAYVARITPILQPDDTSAVAAGSSPAQTMRVSCTQSQLFAVLGEAAADAPGGIDAGEQPTINPVRCTPLDGLFAPVSGNRSQ